MSIELLTKQCHNETCFVKVYGRFNEKCTSIIGMFYPVLQCLALTTRGGGYVLYVHNTFTAMIVVSTGSAQVAS